MVRSLSCVIVAAREESREAIVATNDFPSFLQIMTGVRFSPKSDHWGRGTGSEEKLWVRVRPGEKGQEGNLGNFCLQNRVWYQVVGVESPTGAE